MTIKLLNDTILKNDWVVYVKKISTLLALCLFVLCLTSCSQRANNINTKGDVTNNNNEATNEDIEKDTTGNVANDFAWEITDEGILVLSGHGAMPEWGIKNKVPWMERKDEILGVVIENGLTTIGSHAFSQCENLIDVRISNTVVSINTGAFGVCTSLLSVNIPPNVRYIKEKAFGSCSSLKEITLNEGLYSLGQEVFNSCTSLEKINIPSTVSEIGGGIFAFCYALSNVNVSENSNFVFEEGILYNQDKSILISCLANLKGILVVPKDVREISKTAFLGCKDLTEIILPISLTKINEGVFQNCTRLKSIIIPDRVTEIGRGAFSHCVSLDEIKLSNNLVYIGEDAFSFCYALKSIEIPENVMEIADGAFSSCDNLEFVTIPPSVTKIGKDIFWSGYDLSKAVIVGEKGSVAEQYAMNNNHPFQEILS